MEATVSQVSDTLSLHQQNISDDCTVMEGLLGEAQLMVTNLIGRLDEVANTHELTQFHITLLRGIVGTVELMGLDQGVELKSFLPSNSDDMPIVVTTSHDEDESSLEVTDDDTCDENVVLPGHSEEVESSNEVVEQAERCNNAEEDERLRELDIDISSQEEKETSASLDIDTSSQEEKEENASRIDEARDKEEEPAALSSEKKPTTTSNGIVSWANVVRKLR